jgi:LmbE family N-acetylglucosaminyl deacetylase
VRRGRQRLADRGFGDAAVEVPEFGPEFGEPESAITHAVDVRAHASVKRRAMAAHSSQSSDTSFFLALPEPALTAGFGFEWYIRARPTRTGRPTVIDALADGAAGTGTT